MKTGIRLAIALFFSFARIASAQSPDQTAQRIVNSEKFKAAQAFIDKDYDRFVKEIIQLTEIRGSAIQRGEEREGLSRNASSAWSHQCGDGYRRQRDGYPQRCGQRSAHRNRGSSRHGVSGRYGRQSQTERHRTCSPGIGDDTRSLVGLCRYLRAMEAAKIQTTSDILFIGDVGEEGRVTFAA